MRLILLTFALLLPLPALAAVRLDNCDDVAHQATVEYLGKPQEITLQPGQSEWLPGLPSRVTVGKDVHFDLRLNDFWCIWGKDNLRLQRRIHGGGRRG